MPAQSLDNLLSEWIRKRKRNMFIVSSWFVKDIYIRELSFQLSYNVEETRTGCFEISSEHSWDKHHQASHRPKEQCWWFLVWILRQTFRNISRLTCKEIMRKRMGYKLFLLLNQICGSGQAWLCGIWFCENYSYQHNHHNVLLQFVQNKLCVRKYQIWILSFLC